LRDKYFTPLKKGGYRITSRIKRMVSFGFLNLADLESLRDSSLSCMDMIFCRNVFIYFDQPTILNVMARLHDNLLDGGYLFVGPNELPATRPPGFHSIHRPGAIILRKSSDPDPDTIETTSGAESIFTAFEAITPAASYAIPGMDEAKKAYDNFDYKKASEVLLDRSGPAKDADALVLLAKCYANLGDTKSALHWCEQAIKANPLNPSLYYLQATIWQENGDTKQAISSLRQALGVSSEFVLAEFTLGNLLKQSGQEKEAGDCFAATLKLLQRYNDGDIIPESDGTTAQGLKVIVSSLLAETARPS
jgi:chemotaxis protein methyltransferase CheR